MKVPRHLSLILFFILPAFVATAARNADLAVRASVDRARIELHGQFTLSIEITGADASAAPEPKLPSLEAFAAYVGTSTSQNFQIINGRMSVSKTYNYAFIATAVGRHEIGAATLEYKGEAFSTHLFAIEIVQPAAPPSGQPGSPSGGSSQQVAPAEPGVDLSGSLFLRTQIDRRRVFQNEPVLVSYKIYTRVTVTSYGIGKVPNFSGFWAEDFPLPQQPQTAQEVIDGQRFLVAEIKKVALFPQSIGKKVLGPLEIECDVQVQNRRRSRDFFDSFFDDPFLTRTVRRTVASSPVEIEVEPLPAAGKPANFSGAVGSYTLSATLNRSAVKANEAVTLKVVVSGTGNLRVLSPPALELPPDFEAYEPKIDQTVKYDNNRVSGSKTFEYVLVPRSAGDIEIKPVVFSFFDPRERIYKTISTPPLPLSVAKGSEELVAIGGGISKEDVRLIGQDIRFIASTPVPFHAIGAAFHRSRLFFATGITPVLVLALAFLYRRHQEKLSTNVAYARNRRAGRLSSHHLRSAGHLIGKHNSRPFYAEVQRALMSFAGNKLNVAEAGLLTDELAAMLRERRVPAEDIDFYMHCLQICDLKRFAPGDATEQEMRDFLGQARQALERMERAL